MKLVKTNEFVEKLRVVIPELPKAVAWLNLTVNQLSPVKVECEFYITEDEVDENDN